MSSDPDCPGCGSYRALRDAIAQGKNHCTMCGRIFGAMKERELREIERLIERASIGQDSWSFFGFPRPSVVRRLIDEVRARRELGTREYARLDEPYERNVTYEDVLQKLKEKT